MDETTMKVYVGNYGSYNAGHLIDQCFELPMSPAELDGRLKAMQAEAERLTGSPCEEFYISDYDGYPLDAAGSEVHDMFNEQTPIEDLNLMAAQLSTMSDSQIEAASAYLSQQGSLVSMDEAMNVLLQADEVPYYDYGLGEYAGSDPIYQAIHDSLTAEEKYGYLMAENNPELNALLQSDSAIDSAFDYKVYGRLCAELDGVHLMEDGYLINCDIDMAYFDHEEIAEAVTASLVDAAEPLADSFQDSFQIAADQRTRKQAFDELTAVNNPGTTGNPVTTSPAVKPKRSGLPGPDRSQKHSDPAVDQRDMTAAAKAQSAPAHKPSAKVVN